MASISRIRLKLAKLHKLDDKTQKLRVKKLQEG